MVDDMMLYDMSYPSYKIVYDMRLYMSCPSSKIVYGMILYDLTYPNSKIVYDIISQIYDMILYHTYMM